MSLENEILKLREAIEKLTSKIGNLDKKPLNTIQDNSKEAKTPQKPITLEDVKEMSKNKMVKGISRNELKNIISSIKKDASLLDLNEEELEKAYNLIKIL